MPDDNGTETTRSDSPSADESLFGEAADDTETAAADEQDANEETEQDTQGADDAGDQAVGDETGSSEDLKVVVSLKGGRATIGVQQPSSDPHIESFDDADLSGLTQEVSAVIERARAKWEDEPKYPAHERPAPPARRRNRREQGGGGGGRDRRGRAGATAAGDAEAVLRAGPWSRSARDARPQHTGGGHRDSVSSPCTAMYAAFFAFQANAVAGRLSRRTGGRGPASPPGPEATSDADSWAALLAATNALR